MSKRTKYATNPYVCRRDVIIFKFPLTIIQAEMVHDFLSLNCSKYLVTVPDGRAGIDQPRDQSLFIPDLAEERET